MQIVDSETVGWAQDIAVTGTNLEPILSGKLGSDGIRLTITNRQGSDGMSDFVSPLSGSLSRLNGSGVARPNQTGACTKLPDGTSPRPVIGVTAEAPLNVRGRGNRQARIVGTLPPNASFWAYPEDPVRGWVRGAFIKFPAERGPIRVVEGWVSARYLGVWQPQ